MYPALLVPLNFLALMGFVLKNKNKKSVTMQGKLNPPF